MFRFSQCLPILLPILLLAGCASQENSAPTAIPADPFEGVQELQTEILLVLSDSISTHMELIFPSDYFHDMAIGPDGSLFIQNRGMRNIFHIDAEGTYLASIGQEGQGPGEFQIWPDFDIASFDSLYALDFRKSEVMLFVKDNGDWNYENSFLLEQIEGFQPSRVFYLNRERLAVSFTPSSGSLFTAADQDTLFTRRVDLFSPDGDLHHAEWLSVPANEQFVYQSPSGAGITIPLPYGGRSFMDMGPEGQLYHTWSPEFRIHMHRPGKPAADSIFHASYHLPIGDEVRRQEIEDYSGVRFGNRNLQEQMLDAYLKAIPTEAPALRDMHVDRDNGHIIVRRFVSGDEPNWMLMDREGDRLGVFRLDENLEVFDFRDGKILGAERYEESPPAVRLVSIETNLP